MNKTSALVLSIRKAYGCSMSEAEAFADEIVVAEAEPNGRVGSFEEITESQHVVEDSEDNFFKMKVKARAGIKLEAVSPDTGIMAKIKHMGGVR